MNARNEFYAALGELDRLSLRLRPTPDVQKNIACRLVDAFAAMSQAERDDASSFVSRSEAWKKLLGLSGYLAELAVNDRDKKLIDMAVTLHEIEDFRHDYRENIRYLILINHSARMIGVEFCESIGLISGSSSEESRKRLEEFCKREDSLNRISSIGIREGGEAGDFRFIPVQ